MITARTLRSFRMLPVLVTAFLLALFGGLGTAMPAAAHDELISSSPEDGAVLDEQPSWIELTFSGNIQEIGSEVQVEREGQDYSAGELTADGATLSVALPDDLEPGDYEVVWRVVSEDGHPISGSFSFTLEGAADDGENADDPAGLGGGVVDGGGEDAQNDRGELGTAAEGGGWSPITIVILSLGVLAALAAVVVLLTRKGQFGKPGGAAPSAGKATAAGTAVPGSATGVDDAATGGHNAGPAGAVEPEGEPGPGTPGSGEPGPEGPDSKGSGPEGNDPRS